MQPIFQFLVAVLALAAIGVSVIAGAGQYESSRPVGDHRTPVGALGGGFALQDHPAVGGPRFGPVPEGGKEPLRLTGKLPLFNNVNAPEGSKTLGILNNPGFQAAT